MDREEPASTGQPESPGHDAYGDQLSTHGRSVSDPCQDAIATLYGFLDGELTSERRERIQKAVIARKCRDDVPDSLRRRVAEALRAEDVPT